MGFTIHGYPGGSNSPDAEPEPSEGWPQTVERMRWGIRASAAPECESVGHDVAGIDTEATNRSAAGASAKTLSAAAAEVAARSGLRAESPEGFTAPRACRSQSAYDLAPLILCPNDG